MIQAPLPNYNAFLLQSLLYSFHGIPLNMLTALRLALNASIVIVAQIYAQVHLQVRVSAWLVLAKPLSSHSAF